MTVFKQLQEQKKLSNEQVAKLFNVSTRTITRWRNNEVKAPQAAIIALQVEVVA